MSFRKAEVYFGCALKETDQGLCDSYTVIRGQDTSVFLVQSS